MRAALSPSARTPALLQSAVPGSGAGLVGVEGPADLPRHGGGQAETEPASQRYRKRVKERKPPEKEVVPEAARVISKNFFRWLLRPARLLRVLPALAAIATATVLFPGVSACDGARLGTRATLAKAAWPASPAHGQVAPRAAAVKANG